jgi:hypothetical protein
MKTNTSNSNKKHCSCCGRYLINAKLSTMKEQFCHKCGIVHLGNSLSNEPNEYFEQGYAKALDDVTKKIDKLHKKYRSCLAVTEVDDLDCDIIIGFNKELLKEIAKLKESK